ncbi:hypothetical protein L1987_30347 [Smallanthus sonchifolius]|uniref:Uncharacterized protein n=1 Tax=Smallanthus sonchifolius TaxID=185202 RepID=A0ACB9I366_9ASTR|nr:hypothetical protein L1987_30347 [Smallanthus sonchifolius]
MWGFRWRVRERNGENFRVVAATSENVASLHDMYGSTRMASQPVNTCHAIAGLCGGVTVALDGCGRCRRAAHKVERCSTAAVAVVVASHGGERWETTRDYFQRGNWLG